MSHLYKNFSEIEIQPLHKIRLRLLTKLLDLVQQDNAGKILLLYFDIVYLVWKDKGLKRKHKRFIYRVHDRSICTLLELQ